MKFRKKPVDHSAVCDFYRDPDVPGRKDLRLDHHKSEWRTLPLQAGHPLRSLTEATDTSFGEIMTDELHIGYVSTPAPRIGDHVGSPYGSLMTIPKLAVTLPCARRSLLRQEVEMSDTPRVDEVLHVENNWGAYRGSDGSDGVTPQEAHDDCFSQLTRLARTLERELAATKGAISEASRHKALLRETLDAIASEIDGMADVEDRPEGAGVRPNVFMRLDTLIEAVQGATK